MTSSEKYIISLSLNGKLNFWNLDSLSDNKLPDLVLNGHQHYVSKAVYNKNNSTVISSDCSGKLRKQLSLKIVQWDSNKNATVVHNLHSSKIITISLSCDNQIIYSLDSDLNLIGFDLNSSTKIFSTKLTSGEAQVIQSSRTNPQIVYVLYSNSLTVVNNGKVEAQHSLSFTAKSFAASENELFFGDRVFFYSHRMVFYMFMITALH